MASILDRINEEKEKNKIIYEEKEEEKEKSVNLALYLALTIVSLLISSGAIVALILAFSYDLCIMLDNYYVYIAVVIGCVLSFSIYKSAVSIKKRFSILSIINIIISLITIVTIIIPFVTGLIYF